MKKIMKCEHITEHLDEYLDGTLSKEESVQYHQHFQECQSCQKLGKQMSQIKARYRLNVQTPFWVSVSASKS